MRKQKNLLATAIVAAAAIGLAGAPRGASGQSFNITNVVNPGVLIAGLPTNTLSPNFVVTGYSTNGPVVTTNGFFPPQGTGNLIPVGNYERAGFYASGFFTASNSAGTISFGLVRSLAPMPPAVVTGAGTPALPPGAIPLDTTVTKTITFPIPAGTNVWCYWTTNLDETYVGVANWIGIETITNSTQFGSSTNVSAGLFRKIIPRGFSAGNW